MASLSLPPSHTNFPAASILHAISAMGSFYTAAVTSPPLPNLNEVAADEIYSSRHRRFEDRPDSFAEHQAQLAKDCADRGELLGENMFQHFQGKLSHSPGRISLNCSSEVDFILVLLVSFQVSPLPSNACSRTLILLQMGRSKNGSIAALDIVVYNSQVFVSSAHTLRMCTPMGLNVCPPFHSISKVLR